MTSGGALSVLKDRSEKGNMILDIGGRSSQTAFGRRYELQNVLSINMESVHFNKHFFERNPLKSKQISAAQDEIRRLLSTQQFPEDEFDLIVVAETASSIAVMDLRLKEYDTDN